MSEITARIATTGIVEQGGSRVLVTKEAIHSVADGINGDHAIPLIVDHDPTAFPLGKLIDGWVEPFGDGHAAMARIYLDEHPFSAKHRRTGEELVRLSFRDHPKPFVRRGHKPVQEGRNTVRVDLANFPSMHAYEEFRSGLQETDRTMDCQHGINRHSIGPEPFLALILSDPVISATLAAIGIWAFKRAKKFVTYTVDESMKKVGDELSDTISAKLNGIVRHYVTRKEQDNRPTTTQITIPGDLELNLIIETEADKEIPIINFNRLVDTVTKFGDILEQADSATFMLSKTENWKLQYLTTKSGETIGTKECYDRTIEQLTNSSQSHKSPEQNTAPKE